MFHSVSYRVELDGPTSGSATVIVEDIRSDAMNSEELDSDKKNLFEFISFINQREGVYAILIYTS